MISHERTRIETIQTSEHLSSYSVTVSVLLVRKPCVIWCHLQCA